MDRGRVRGMVGGVVEVDIPTIKCRDRDSLVMLTVVVTICTQVNSMVMVMAMATPWGSI